MPFTVIKRDADGNFELSYSGELVERGADYVCVDAVFELDDRDLGFVQLRRGDRFREWFYAGKRFNIFRVADGQSGALKGWYCNITRLPDIDDCCVAADDLCLDVFVYPDGAALTLDETEFDALNLADAERAQARSAVRTLRDMAERRTPPFDEIGEAPTPGRGG